MFLGLEQFVGKGQIMIEIVFDKTEKALCISDLLI